MRKAFAQIEAIVAATDDSKTPALNMTLHLSKHSEEAGEMAQSINKLNGRKKRKGESEKEILDNIIEEGCDTIQCIMAIMINAGADYDRVNKTLKKKNKEFKKAVVK